MADKITGIERLRMAARQSASKDCEICKAADKKTPYNCVFDCNYVRGESLTMILEQIERERVDGIAKAKRGMAELKKRLMPEGMEWPRFEDGELVRIGDAFIASDDDGEEFREVVDYIKFGKGEYTIMSEDASWFEYAQGERVKRPNPEVLGADGLPIRVGETVYVDAAHADMVGLGPVGSIGRCGLCGVEPGQVLTVANVTTRGNVDFNHPDRPFCPASWLTHAQDDTQERIDEDNVKGLMDYWGCEGVHCYDCPSKIDGENPNKHYGVLSCYVAQGMDIARRQRELDARTKGGES